MPRKSIQQLVIEDIEKREQHGIRTFGTAIFDDTPNDPSEGGPIGQAYEEVIDLAIYLRWYISRHGTSAAFAFGALRAIESGEWDSHLDQLSIAILQRKRSMK